MRPLRLLLLLLITLTTLLILSLLPRRSSSSGSARSVRQATSSPLQAAGVSPESASGSSSAKGGSAAASGGSPQKSSSTTSSGTSASHGGNGNNNFAARSRFSPFFSFHSPLFPSSAIISLTDDNSTFFLSRPAAFGPTLSTHGLSGQLWVGRGFGMDDPLGRLGMMSDVELGCSDVPGWDESRAIKIGGHGSSSSRSGSGYIDTLDKHSRRRRSVGSSSDAKKVKDAKNKVIADDDDDDDKKKKDEEDVNDGTDDYLNSPFILDRAHADHDNTVQDIISNENDDIQTLQESAEIQGKIVLLSRGGCGFLEKVKWAQRRGGVALIVGDNIPGGALVTMYAKGDTVNITIPSIFTSYTTAHLLSSLIPNGGLTAGASSESVNARSKSSASDSKAGSKGTVAEKESFITKKSSDGAEPSFFRRIIACLGLSCSREVKTTSSSTRPPTSGRHDWVMVEDWNEPLAKSEEPGKTGSKDDSAGKKSKEHLVSDDFVIGVHDWRNPDLKKKPTPAKNGQAKPTPKSGSVQSGQETLRNAAKVARAQMPDANMQKAAGRVQTDKAPSAYKPGSNHFPMDSDLNAVHPHEGLWVTLTPTAMSSSPFIDTLLVLVVSPLVTLTVVYAMLLIRSRIRRRRWRAPKSVVERLPVRTYHTMPGSATGSTTSLAASITAPLLSPGASAGSRAHSRQRQRPKLGRRPRSRTTSGVFDTSSAMILGPSDTEPDVPSASTPLLLTPTGSQSPHIMTSAHQTLLAPHSPIIPTIGVTVSSDDDSEEATSLTESEKREKGLAEWRRRYGGRQRECVVCLEEYVDGVSRVMSLPCGHEFHVECITPWLTTRRRTCPICKGDVVRSLARQEYLQGGSRGDMSRSPAPGRYRDSPRRGGGAAGDDADGEDGFDGLDDAGVEDGPLPPFAEHHVHHHHHHHHHNQDGPAPFRGGGGGGGGAVGALATGAGAVWGWVGSATAGARVFVADRISSVTGAPRGRRRSRRD